jgi:hypothetical protein
MVGAILVVIGIYLAAAAAVALANHSHPEHTTVGIALTEASVLVLPVLAQAKLRLATTRKLRVARRRRTEFGWCRLGRGDPGHPSPRVGLGLVVGRRSRRVLIAGTLLREGLLISPGTKRSELARQAVEQPPAEQSKCAWALAARHNCCRPETRGRAIPKRHHNESDERLHRRESSPGRSQSTARGMLVPSGSSQRRSRHGATPCQSAT